MTLLEVAVALALAGLLLITARLLLVGTADAADIASRRIEATDRHANAHRVLRRLIQQAELGSREAPFGGDAHAMQLTTWCAMPAGWLERCRAVLRFDMVDGAPALVAQLSTGTTLVLAKGFSTGALRYLGDVRHGGTWFDVWEPGIALPTAIGVNIDGDTIILAIGARG